MKLLITGGLGYIGSHCVVAALNAGYDVLIFDKNSRDNIETDVFLKNMRSSDNYIGFFKGNLCNKNDIFDVFNEGIDAVIHFAALSQVNESMKKPSLYYKNNVLGTMNLLDAMVEHNVEKIVFSSTAATYGEPEYTPIDENYPQNPINPYGNTKLVVERMMGDYGKAYGIRSVRLRYFNVTGADEQCRVGERHDPETHLVPNILRSTFDNGKEFSIFGDDYPTRDGTCIRDYVNVEDLADAHILALRYLENGGKTDFFNIGTNSGSTVKEVFDECERVTGEKIPLKVEGRRPGDPAVLVADNKKAKQILGWEPKRTLSDSIRTAYAWERKMHGQ